MLEAEAKLFLAEVIALSPWPAVPDSTRAFWIKLLQGHEHADAQAALAEYGIGAMRNRAGHLDIERIAAAIRSKRDQRTGSQLALGEGNGIGFGEALERDPGLAARVNALRDKIATPHPALVQMTPAEVEAEGQLVPKRKPRPFRGCAGSGKTAIERDGELVCPDCGAPIDPDAVPAPRGTAS